MKPLTIFFAAKTLYYLVHLALVVSQGNWQMFR